MAVLPPRAPRILLSIALLLTSAGALVANLASADCSWCLAPSCVQSPWEFDGQQKAGCRMGGDGKGWCSHDAVYEGSWSSCSYICGRQLVSGDTLAEPLSIPGLGWLPTEEEVAVFNSQVELATAQRTQKQVIYEKTLEYEQQQRTLEKAAAPSSVGEQQKARPDVSAKSRREVSPNGEVVDASQAFFIDQERDDQERRALAADALARAQAAHDERLLSERRLEYARGVKAFENRSLQELLVQEAETQRAQEIRAAEDARIAAAVQRQASERPKQPCDDPCAPP